MNRIKRIRNFYLPFIGRENINARRLAWESSYSQRVRFEALTRHLNLEGFSLLDVGCGLCDLYEYLKKRAANVQYTGVDILEDNIDEVKRRYPDIELINSDPFKEDFYEGRIFDVVYASGTFNVDLDNNYEFLERVIDVFYKLSRKAFAFNLLHERSEDKDKHLFYTSPEKILPFLNDYECTVDYDDTYLKNDFTVFCYKEDLNGKGR